MKTSEQKAKRWLKVTAFSYPLISLLHNAFPFILKGQINKLLENSKDFSGHVKTIRFAPFKMRCTIKDACIEVVEEEEGLDFCRVDELEIAFNRKEMRKGIINLNLTLSGASLVIIKDKTRIHERIKPQMDLPFMIEQFKIKNVQLQFIDELVLPPIDLKMHEIKAEGCNITNMEGARELPARINAAGKICDGELKTDLRLGLSEEKPAFDVNLQVKNLDMTQLNDLFSVYGKFKLLTGEMNLYTEIASKNGSFKGYVKPLIKDLKVDEEKEKSQDIRHFIWDKIIEAGTKILENGDNEIGSKIPFEGTFEQPKIKIGPAILHTLKNAFITALKPNIDYDININSIKK